MIAELQCEACFKDYCKANIVHDEDDFYEIKHNYDWIRNALDYDCEEDLYDDLPEDDLHYKDDDDYMF